MLNFMTLLWKRVHGLRDDWINYQSYRNNSSFHHALILVNTQAFDLLPLINKFPSLLFSASNNLALASCNTIDSIFLDHAACTHVLKYGTRHEHETTCPFSPTTCPFSSQCGKIRRRDLAKHLDVCSRFADGGKEGTGRRTR